MRLNFSLFRLKKVAGVELIFLTDNSMAITVCLLEIENGVVEEVSKITGLTSIKQLKEFLPENTPVALAVSGKGILHKRVNPELSPELPLAEALKATFPNIQQEDFYVQQYCAGGGSILSLSRKDVVEGLLKFCSTESLSVIALTFGPFVVDILTGFLNFKDEPLPMDFQSAQITIIDTGIVNFRIGPFEKGTYAAYEIGEQTIKENWLLAYAAALQVLLNGNPRLQNQIPKIKENAEEWRQRSIFKVAGLGSLAVLFLVLLVNFLLFNSFLETNYLLESRLNNQSADINKIRALQSQIAEKNKFLKNTGWLTVSKNSFYADQLGKSLPEGIQLVQLEINPFEEQRSKIEKGPVFSNNLIQVKGRCREPQRLNEWLKRINKLTWVKSIESQDYLYDEKNKFAEFSFAISIRN